MLIRAIPTELLGNTHEVRMHANDSLEVRSTCSIMLQRELFLHFTADLCLENSIIESVDSISRDGPDTP